jgi:iron complex outermembrane receptor protein
MNIKWRLASTVAIVQLVMTLDAGQASAQAQSQSQSQAQSQSQIQDVDEIVVTARRVSENIEKVPEVVTAFTSEAIANRGIETEEDIQLSTPGLTLRETEGQNSLTYAIRGQTVDAFSGSATAVVPYFNEVQANSQGAGSFFDLESIQVLKGPQGTLFGRNATGGAVLYSTVKPSNDLDGYLQVSGGNFNYNEAQGAINVPLVTDKVLLRVAFDVADRDGYQRNVYYNTILGAMEHRTGRVSLTLRPIDALENTTVLQYGYSGGTNTSVKLFSAYTCGQKGPDGSTLNCAANAAYNPTAVNALFGPGAWNRYLAGNPGILISQPNARTLGLPGYLAYSATQPFYDVATPVGSFHHEDNASVSNTTTYHVTGDILLKNILGYTRDSSLDDSGEFGAPYGVQYTENLGLHQYGNDVTVRQYSDEIQLQGKAFDEAVAYIAGAYYQYTYNHTFYPQTYFNFEPLAPGSYETSIFWNKDDNQALFTQGTYDFGHIGLEGLKFTAGGRYSWEQISNLSLPGATNGNYGTPEQHVSFSKPSWIFGLDYQLTPAVMTYIETRGSWRSGGINGNAPAKDALASGGGDLFLPETVRDIEIGVKAAGSIFDRPAHLNVALYDQWVRNVQRTEFPTDPATGASIATTINVPSANMKGVEAEAAFSPISWVQVGGNVAYIDAKYTKMPVDIFGIEYVFGPYADTPEWSGTLFTQLKLPVPNESVLFRADWYVQSSQVFSDNADSIIPEATLPGYGIVNLHMNWQEMLGTNIGLSLWCKNLLDKEYYVGGLAQGASFGTNAAAIGRPRMYGVDLKYKF